MGGRGSKSGMGSSSASNRNQAMIDRLTAEGMSKQNARRYVGNENEIRKLERELDKEMSSTETRHSVSWREDMRKRIDKLRDENERLRWGR